MAHKNTTNIPKARQDLESIAKRLDSVGQSAIASELREIVATKMTRRVGLRRSPQRRSVVTPEIKRAVIDDLRNTRLAQEEIGRRYNIDGGRVSEIYAKMRN